MYTATGDSEKKIAIIGLPLYRYKCCPLLQQLAAEYHSACVYYQTKLLVEKGTNLNAEEWGWVTAEDRLEPLQTNLPPAPDFLMKVICFNCKTDCDTWRCTCRKLGIE